MSRSRRTAKDAGTRFERLVADYLAGRLGSDIDRQVKTGSRDTGDIRGVSVAGRGIAIECKDYQGGARAAQVAARGGDRAQEPRCGLRRGRLEAPRHRHPGRAVRDHDIGDVRGDARGRRQGGIAMECTNIPVEIEAKFKQATVKGGVAVLQFEVDTEDSAAFDAIRKSGEEVWLSIQSKQPQILFVSHDGEVTE